MSARAVQVLLATLLPASSALQLPSVLSRRVALSSAAAAAVGPLVVSPALAAERQFFKTDSGIRYFDIKEGKGYSPFPGQIVILSYKSFLSDGRMYDSSEGPGRKKLAAAFQAKPSQMIVPAWEEVLGDMKEGGTRVIQVPPELAYGEKGICLENGECLVPPNEKLQFQITLERVALPPP